MKKEVKPKNFIPKPEYPGGPKAMNAFIQSHLKYPESALTQNIEGTVVLKAEINYKGVVIDTKIISSLGHDFDEEASRVVRLLKFNVDKIRNMKISYFRTFNIHFNPPVQQNLNIQYNYVLQNESGQNKKQESNKTSYNIIIKFN